MELEDEDLYKLGSDYAYLIPFLESELKGGGSIMEAEQDEAGGQSQERRI